MMRAAALATAVWTCASLVPGSAAAHSLIRPAGPVVSYLSADATSLNTLEARVSGNRIEFRDETVDGGMDPGSCTPGELDRSGYIIQTFCPLAGIQRVRIDLGEREDTANVALPVPVTVLAGPGADRVTAGATGDELSGGDGNDLLDGGAGDDVLSGDQGIDNLSGGPGADRFAIRDGVADTISCGEGPDTVDADTVDRVGADCESVTRTLTAPPGDAGADDGRPPRVDVGAPTLQRLGRARAVRVYATSSERGALSASGSLEVAGLALPVKTIARRAVRVGGGGAVLTYRLRGRHWREARRALRRGRRVVVRLGVVATDLAGQSTRRDAPPITLEPGGRAAVRARAAHPEPGDRDGDEVRDEVDNCPDHKNGTQRDADGDGAGDACDGDDDADGVLDDADNCRTVANPDQTPDEQFPEYGAACDPTDDDGDGVVHFDDNCPAVSNPAPQSDIDGDDRGDACDEDDDGDIFEDGVDNCPTVYNIDYDYAANRWYQQDHDGDGVGTACDADESVVGGPPDAGPGDGVAPRVKVGVERRIRLAAFRAGLVVRLRCSEACDATVELQVPRGLARSLGLSRSRVLAGGSARLQGAGTTYAFVRFDRRARRKLFRQRRLRATLKTVAVDPGGSFRRVERRVALVR